MTTERLLWTSTVAFSAYNLIALVKAPATLGDITDAVHRAHDAEQIPDDQIAEAMDELVKRGWVVFDADAMTYMIRDPKWRFARERSRTGEGWDDWKVARMDGGDAVPIERATA